MLPAVLTLTSLRAAYAGGASPLDVIEEKCVQHFAE